MWFLLAIIVAILQWVKETSLKSNLKNINSNILIFLLAFFSVLFWLPFIVYFWIPDLSIKFWWVFLLSGFTLYVWKLLNFRAMQAEEISYIAPFRWLIMICVVIFSFILLWEYPSVLGWLGIFLILLWIYLLNITKYHTKFLDPILHITKNKSFLFILFSSIFYWLTTVLDKIGLSEAYPIFWIFIVNLYLVLISSKNFISTFSSNKKSILNSYNVIVITFILYLLIQLIQMEALKLIYPWYFSWIKNSSMLFTIILWWIFFNEKDIKKKLLTWLFIVLWVILIIVWK